MPDQPGRETTPGEFFTALSQEKTGHAYTSTACQHLLHTHCRLVCKFCSTPCDCRCHR